MPLPTDALERLQSKLLTSDVRDKVDMALYEILRDLIRYLRQTTNVLQTSIAEGGGGDSGDAITALTTDVVAVGPGVAVATIQPDAVTTLKIIDNAVTTPKIIDDAITTLKILDNNVTYGKIQQVSGLRLVGNPDAAPADMVEIPIGDGIAFLNGTLVVEIEPGVPGLLHRLLSTTHYDTVPATAEYGDLIRATTGPDFEGEYYGFTINAPIVEDFSGIRFGLTRTPDVFVGNYFAAYPPALDYVEVTPPDTWLAWEYIDFFVLAPLTEDFSGIRVGLAKFNYLAGNNFALYPPELDFIVPPSPANEDIPAIWERMGIGAEDEVLTVVDGTPTWAVIPEPPPDPIPAYEWVDIPWDAGDFTAAGGTSPTWDVEETDLIAFQYQTFPGNDREEDNVRIRLYIRESTVGGTAPDQLIVQLPFSIVGQWAGQISIQENLTAPNDTFVAYGAGSQLTIQKIPFEGGGPPFDTTADGTFLSFEIAAVLA